ncbi:uncharacterized protein [Rutidosis leptorrhynchoides]|uniref:uncharacterized protein n=1 Tax=Rutidosis leptorrhynchoides TaxID=125765 RepID=UPI003A99D9ED
MRLREQPNIVAIQESKCNEVSDNWMEYVCEAVEGKFFLAIKGKWKGSDRDTIVVNVYGPHIDSGKKDLWDGLEKLMLQNDAEWVICGDFEVRDQSERLNRVFVESKASLFNDFIERMQLIEIPLLGKKFTRISDNRMKLSKLDRFLVSENFTHTWGDLSVIALDRNTSDHCLIALRNNNVDFGPKPDKMKNVKEALRVWSKTQFRSLDFELEEAKNKACDLENKAESGPLSDSEKDEWIQARGV